MQFSAFVVGWNISGEMGVLWIKKTATELSPDSEKLAMDQICLLNFIIASHKWKEIMFSFLVVRHILPSAIFNC